MTAVIATSPKFTFTSSSGAPLSGGSVDVYLAGTTTRTPTWQDRAQTTLNTNPIVLDSRGEAVIWLDAALTYKFVLKNAGGVAQYTVDNIVGNGAPAATVAEFTIDRFSGTGAQVDFTLSTTPSSENTTDVYVAGVYQQKNTYSLVGTTLTFAVAPANGVNNIEVKTLEVTDYAAVAANLAALAAAAEASADDAADSADDAQDSLDEIDNRIYPGVYAVAPTTRPDASAIVAGDIYFDSTTELSYRWNGTTWVASDINTANLAASGGSALIGHNDTTVAAWLNLGRATFGEVTYQTNEAIAGAFTIACYGDSLTYGYDPAGTEVGINGSADIRALYQFPEALGAALTKAGITATVTNRGYPGDTSATGLTRWSAVSATNIAILMYGTNDAVPSGGLPTVSQAQFKANMRTMIEREQTKGAFVILLSPPRLKQPNTTGVIEQRQQWIMANTSILKELADHYSIPLYSADELISHRGPAIYSDGTHLDKYGYNELGWNLAAAIVTRRFNVPNIGGGYVTGADGGIMQGPQSSLNGNTVIALATAAPAVIAAYFTEDVVAVAEVEYNTVLGGTQRVAIELSGGTRSAAYPALRVAAATTVAGAKVHSEVIPKGLRTVFLQVSSTTTNSYVRRVRFYGLGQRLFTDAVGGNRCDFGLSGLSFPISADANRWVINDCAKLVGDFDVTFALDLNPGAANESGGMSLIFGYAATDGSPDKYINVLRSNADQCVVRIADPGFTDFTTAGVVFTGNSSTMRVTRVGTAFEVFADGVSVHTFTHVADTCKPALQFSRLAITCREAYQV